MKEKRRIPGTFPGLTPLLHDDQRRGGAMELATQWVGSFLGTGCRFNRGMGSGGRSFC
jgi:hypothetical protein